ncbi:hypothetical protein ACIBSV_14780 [Embleya sp. NPDC050154]|uniref:hypothetical protein n=1 Tax=Embleya sp. NPDC050154 TaxID=3363988 RepID=UPI0037953DC2
MIQHLPARDSATHRELHGEAADWSLTDHLLANAVDHLAVLNWMFGTVNSGEDQSPMDFPEPTMRPDSLLPPTAAAPAPSDRATEVSPAELATFFS